MSETIPELQQRADGWYARAPGTDWAGPWSSAWEAQRYFRMIFGLDD